MCTGLHLIPFHGFVGDPPEPLDANGVADIFMRDRGIQLLGDLDGNGVIDEIDREIMRQNWGDCECCAADLNGDGVVDHCDRRTLLQNSICVSATITSSNPATGTVDARQPFAPGDPDELQGIGTDDEKIIITLDHTTGGLENCFVICESDSVVEVDPVLQTNGIKNVSHLGSGSYEIELQRPIKRGSYTTITYLGGDSIFLISHPSNVNADGMANGSDTLYLIDILNSVQSPPYGLYSADIDHSGVLTAADITRQVDLLNGAGSYETWNATDKPADTGCDCGGTQESMMGGGGEGESFASFGPEPRIGEILVYLLTSATESTALHVDFSGTALSIAQLAKQQLDETSLVALHDILLSSELTYISTTAQDMAKEIAALLTEKE